MKKLILFILTIISITVNAATYYVAPSGGSDSNAGTIGSPWATWQKAFNTAVAGDTVYFRGGTWAMTGSYTSGHTVVSIAPHNTPNVGYDGTAANPICYFNYPGEVPILDCSAITCTLTTGTTLYYLGLSINRGNYLKFKGLTITGVLQKADGVRCIPITMYACTNLTFENCVSHNNGGTGFELQATFRYQETPGVFYWPEQEFILTDTLKFINCDSYDNADEYLQSVMVPPLNPNLYLGDYSDGFFISEYSHDDTYVLFEGCRAWDNSDDGFDNPSLARVDYKSCWAWANGRLAAGGGNGIRHSMSDGYADLSGVMTNCLMAYNRSFGYAEGYIGENYLTLNIFNNTSYHNGIYGFVTAGWRAGTVRTNTYRNNIAWENGTFDVACTDGGPIAVHDHNAWPVAYNITPPNPDISPAVTITDLDFMSLDSSQLRGARQSNGSLPEISFLKLSSTSDMIDVGVDVGLDYLDTAPDLGYAEYGAADTTALVVFTTSAYPSINYAMIGVNVYDDGGDGVMARGVCWGTSVNPTISNDTTVNGSGIGTFIARIEPLLTNTTYHVRGYAINQYGTGYGEDLQFTTLSASDKVAVYVGGKPLYDPATGKQIFTHAGSLPQTVLVTGITVSGTGGATTISADGGTLQMIATVLPTDATDKTVTWSVTNGTGSASISSSGLLTATTDGNVTVRATANDDSDEYDDQVITISNQDIVTSISIWGTGGATTISTDGGTLQMLKKTLPTSASDTTATWSVTGGTGSASISAGGILTAIADGTVTARATANDGSGIYDDQVITISNQEAPPEENAIIADHTIVDRFDDIPQLYIDSIKKMWVAICGASHGSGYGYGCDYLELIDSKFQVYFQGSGAPDGPTNTRMRINEAMWGNYLNETGWQYYNGEEDFWTNSTILARRKAGLDYCVSIGNIPYIVLYGWSYDASQDHVPGGTISPTYHVRWAGKTVNGIDGNLRWGLTIADQTETLNRVSMDTYINAVNEYNAYCAANDISTKFIFTTGSVDNLLDFAIGENGYQQYLKWKHIRDYVSATSGTILLDYADILSYNDAGQAATTTWTDYNSTLQTFPMIHSDNMGGDYVAHIGSVGAIRLAKAMWWMLARMAGWDGN